MLVHGRLLSGELHERAILTGASVGLFEDSSAFTVASRGEIPVCDVSRMALLGHIPYHRNCRITKLDSETDRAMLDHPEKTARLLAALKMAVPFEVELAPSVMKTLQTDKVDAASRSRQIVSGLSYLGDEGGIMCHIAPPESDSAIIISLTHVRVSRSMPLATVVSAYQKHRVKKLKKQGHAGRPASYREAV